MRCWAISRGGGSGAGRRAHEQTRGARRGGTPAVSHCWDTGYWTAGILDTGAPAGDAHRACAQGRATEYLNASRLVGDVCLERRGHVRSSTLKALAVACRCARTVAAAARRGASCAIVTVRDLEEINIAARSIRRAPCASAQSVRATAALPRAARCRAAASCGSMFRAAAGRRLCDGAALVLRTSGDRRGPQSTPPGKATYRRGEPPVKATERLSRRRCGDTADSDGGYWACERAACGGAVVTRRGGAAGSAAPN